jgi:hemerythrin superfamily protein
MSEADRDRAEAAAFPKDDVISVLYRQHADIRDALGRVQKSSDDERLREFEAVKALLGSHEAAEEKLIRPITAQIAGAVADARADEEAQAATVIATLSAMDVNSSDFESTLAEFVKAVGQHAEAEEHDEFPVIEQNTTPEKRRELGTAFLAEVATRQP